MAGETVWQPINPAILIHEATNFNSLSSKSRRTNIKTAAELSLLLYSMCAQSKSGNLSKPLDNLKLTRGFKSLIISGSFLYRLQWMKIRQNVSLKPILFTIRIFEFSRQSKVYRCHSGYFWHENSNICWISFLAGKIKYLKNCFSVFLTWKFKWDFQSLKANPEDQIYIDQFFTDKIPDYFHNIFWWSTFVHFE